MKKTHSIRTANISPATECILGIVIAALSTIIIISILALFITNEYIDIKTPVFLIGAIHILSTFTGAFVTIKLVKQKAIITSAVVGGGYYVLLLCVAMLLFDRISTDAVVGIIGCATGSVLAIVVDTAPKKKNYRRRRSKRFC